MYIIIEHDLLLSVPIHFPGGGRFCTWYFVFISLMREITSNVTEFLGYMMKSAGPVLKQDVVNVHVPLSRMHDCTATPY